MIFAAADYMHSESLQFDSIASGIEAIIVLLFCIGYFFAVIRGSNTLLLYSTFNFWAIIAFFIYFSGTFFLYLMTEKMMHDIKFQGLYFLINISFNIVKNIMLCVAMTMKIKGEIKEPKSTLPDLGDDLLFYPQNN